MLIPKALLTCLVALVLFFPALLWADVVVLTSGERLEGRVYNAPGDADSIMYQNGSGDIKILRSRIQSIEEESDVMDQRRIADQHFTSKRYAKALEVYLEAQRLAPNDEEIKKRIALTRDALDREATVERRQQIARIDALLEDTRNQIKALQFKDAEKNLNDTIPSLQPANSQSQQVGDLKKDLYLAWGRERLDKLSGEEAAIYFEKLLKIDPYNQEAFNHLIEIWSTKPEKSPQVIEAYKIRLELEPNDHVTRKKLADKLYAQGLLPAAFDQYNTLYKSGEFRKSQIEKNIVSILETLYKREQNAGNFNAAIDYYKQLQLVNPELGPEKINELNFAKEWASIAPSNIDARTSAALKARQKGLTDIARRRLFDLYNVAPEHQGVKRALKLYATEDLKKAQAASLSGQWSAALTASNQIIRDYPFHEDIVEQATQIAGKSQTEMVRDVRERRQTALQYKEQGDQYLARAESAVNILRDTQRDESIRVSSDKQRAIRFYALAIDYYTQALNLWPSMDRVIREEIMVNMRQAQQSHRSLTSPVGRPLPRSDFSLGR